LDKIRHANIRRVEDGSASYLISRVEVPVHADIPHQVIFLDDTDPISAPMKAKVLPNSASAGLLRRSPTRSATGVRVRDYPITLD
jgi:hypothetical protein